MTKRIFVYATTCPNCGKTHNVAMTQEQAYDWEHGGKVQEVFPDWSPSEREKLLTGMCSDECWNKYLGV